LINYKTCDNNSRNKTTVKR